jgi:N-methylhydantoinase B
MVPLHVSRYEMDPESAGAGRWRGGWGTILEIQPVDHTTQVNFLGDGMTFPPPSVLGARSPYNAERTFIKHLHKSDGSQDRIQLRTIRKVSPDQRLEIRCPGGGGVGDPFERDPQAVLEDVRQEMLTVACARDEYGVAIDPDTLEIDINATSVLREGGRPD